MGTPCHIIGISKDIRGRNGKCPGDTVHVIIAKDDEPRVVEVPSDLKAEMDRNPHARSAFDKLSYSHQREHVAAILEAKRPETRKRRIEKAIAILIEERHR